MDYIFDNKVEIIGDFIFEAKTKLALEILRDRDKLSYDVVSLYVGIIKQNRYTGMDVFAPKPTALIGPKNSNLNIFLYASIIVHEAMHSFLFFRARSQGKNGVDEYKGHDAEMFCLTKQIEALKNIRAPEHLIKHAESLYDSKWYEVPISKRNW